MLVVSSSSCKNEIKKAVQEGVFFLLICGAYQLFGKYYKGVEGNIIPGLDIFPYYTEAVEDRKKRCIGNMSKPGIIFPSTPL